IDVRQLGSELTLKKVIFALYDRLEKMGMDPSFLIDEAAFQKHDPNLDLYTVPIDLSRLPDQMTFAALMKNVLQQLPGGNAELLVGPNQFEITTTDALRERDLSSGFMRNPFRWLTGHDGPEPIPLSEIEGSSRGLWFGAAVAGGIAIIAYIG